MPALEAAGCDTPRLDAELLIADALGRIPATGDVVEHAPLRLEVREMAGYRVALARVCRIEREETSVDDGEANARGDGI